MMNSHKSADVVVVGAGVAGLAAARDLMKGGLNVLVLEASRRAGGRILTARSDSDFPIELGAEFIHGEAPETIKLLDEAGLAYLPVGGDHFLSRSGRLERQQDMWDGIQKVFRHMNADRKTDRSFQEFLDTEPGGAKLGKDRKMALTFIQGFNGADPNLIGEKALADQGDPTEGARQMRRIVNGYSALVDYLYRDLFGSVLFDARVERISWTDSGVALVDQNLNVYRARCAVVTVPLPMLKDSSIAFEPELPQIRSAASSLEMGHAVRACVVVKERFWEKIRANIGFVHSTELSFNAWWTQNPITSPLITGWSGGPQAVALLESGTVEQTAITDLAQLFGVRVSTVEKNIESIFTHDWRNDPYARGAYSYAGVGGANGSARLARHVSDSLLFAGEATSSESSGTVEGAIVSGKRSAKKVLRLTLGGR